MIQVLYLIVGGSVGTLLRYGITNWMQRAFTHPFPFGILSVNLIGSLLIGLCFSLSETFSLSPNVRLFLFTGFFGGFTTFSSFTLDTMNLMRMGEYKLAIVNLLASNLLGLVAVFIGYLIGKQITLMK